LVVLNPIFFVNITRKRDNTKIAVKGVTSITVDMTRKNPADICEVEFPNHRDIALDIVDEGDDIGVALGFKEFEVRPVFLGTITEINPNLPLKIKCESVATAARQNPYKNTYADASWVDIAKDALSRGGMVAQVSPYPPPTKPPKKFRVDGQTPAEVLDTVAEETGFVWYAVPGTEDGYFGPPGEEPPNSPGRRFRFTVGENVYADSCDIEYIKARRIKKVVVTLTDADYKQPPVTATFTATDYKDGDAEKRIKPDPVSLPDTAKSRMEQAETRAEMEYLKLSTSGFSGSFKAVGNPFINQGLRIALKVPNYDDKFRHVTVENVKHILRGGKYEIDVDVAGGYEED